MVKSSLYSGSKQAYISVFGHEEEKHLRSISKFEPLSLTRPSANNN